MEYVVHTHCEFRNLCGIRTSFCIFGDEVEAVTHRYQELGTHTLLKQVHIAQAVPVAFCAWFTDEID